MVSIGGDGDIYFWDLKNFCCIKKINILDNWIGTKILISKDFLISGNECGSIYIYEVSKKVLFKNIFSLTTKITNIKIDYHKRILIICSRYKKNAIKFMDIKSGNILNYLANSKIITDYIYSIG